MAAPALVLWIPRKRVQWVPAPLTHHSPLGLSGWARLWRRFLGRLSWWWRWRLWRGRGLRFLWWGLGWLGALRGLGLGHWRHLWGGLEGRGLLQLVWGGVWHLLLPLRVQVQDLVADV